MTRLCALLLWLLAALPALAQDLRVAMVVGNADYAMADRLANPLNDARAMAAKLDAMGFRVILAENTSGQDLRKALGDFTEQALNADIALFYYAGHGIEIGGENFLIPVDAEMRSEATARLEALRLDEVLLAVNAARTLGIVLLDACRNNPFSQKMQRRDGSRAISRGLAPVSVEGETGLVVSFAAEAGTTASDGQGQHSPYTEALLTLIDQPGLEVGRMFRSLRARVREATGGVQVPVEMAQLPEADVYLVAASAQVPTAAPAVPVPAAQPMPIPAAPAPARPNGPCGPIPVQAAQDLGLMGDGTCLAGWWLASLTPPGGQSPLLHLYANDTGDPRDPDAPFPWNAVPVLTLDRTTLPQTGFLWTGLLFRAEQGAFRILPLGEGGLTDLSTLLRIEDPLLLSRPAAQRRGADQSDGPAMANPLPRFTLGFDATDRFALAIAIVLDRAPPDFPLPEPPGLPPAASHAEAIAAAITRSGAQVIALDLRPVTIR